MYELKKYLNVSIRIFANNQSIITLIVNLKNHKRTKHILIQIHYVKKLMKQTHVQFDYINTKKIIANNLTKTFDFTKFKNFVRMFDFVSTFSKCN